MLCARRTTILAKIIVHQLAREGLYMVSSGMLTSLLALAIFMVAIFEWFYLWVLCAFGSQRALKIGPRTLGAFIYLTLIAVIAVTSMLLSYFLHDDRQINLLTLLPGLLIPALWIVYLRSSMSVDATT